MVVRESWKEYSIEELCKSFTKQTGFDYSASIKPSLIKTPKKDYISFIQNKDFQGNTINYETDYYVPKHIAHNFSQILLNEKCLLISISGAVGNVGVFSNIKESFIGGAVAVAKFKDKSLLNWVMYYLFSNEGQQKLLSNMKSGSHKNLILADIRKINIPIPPKQEQQAIATALSDTDALINALEKLIAKKEAIKIGTMQELLTGKKRLDGFCGEWVEKKLGDIVHVVSGGTPSTTISSYWDGTINWYTPTEIGKNKYVTSSLRKLTDEGYQNSSAKILPIGAILFTSRAGIGDTSILLSEGCTNQGFQSLVAKTDIDNEFVYYLTSILKNKFLQNASGSTFLEISPNKVRQIDIFIPPYQEQTAIATILSDMDKEIEALKSKLSKAKVIKEGMMEELLTGKTRLV